ncbi:hypothetical protein D3C85_1552440 [compost metagenome]
MDVSRSAIDFFRRRSDRWVISEADNVVSRYRPPVTFSKPAVWAVIPVVTLEK